MDALDRRLGLTGSVAVGMSAMIGAGLFVVFAPAVSAAGSGLLLALGLAAAVAACNATSSARLARRHPEAGGTYVFGRERLGPFWGHLAGWCFVGGKLASCAAMATAFGSYVLPGHATTTALLAVLALTVLNLAGVQRSATVGLVLVVAVVLVVTVSSGAMLAAPRSGPGAPPDSTPGGVLEASALLFFAFAGYARLATLGEEVRRPTRTIPLAIGLTFTAVVTLYALAAIALLHVLGAESLGTSVRPFVSGLEAAGHPGLVPLVVVAAALAAGGALLSLLLGVSRTALAMARDHHLPRALARVSPRTRVPFVAEPVVGAVVALLVCVGDLVTSVAFSSFCVLLYYAITNASAWALGPGRLPRVVAAAGLAGCLSLAASLPGEAVTLGALVVAAGALSYRIRRPRPVD